MPKDKGETKKNDSPAGVILSVSKSQKTAAKRLAQKRLAAPIQRGGKCSCCGEVAKTCTTGSRHDACIGYFEKEFTHPALETLARRAGVLCADGSPYNERMVGIWLPIEQFNLRLEERAQEAFALLRKERHVCHEKIAGEGGKPQVVISFRDGNGDPIGWYRDRWVHEEKVSDETKDLLVWASTETMGVEDPGLSEKPSVEEQGEEPIPEVVLDEHAAVLMNADAA